MVTAILYVTDVNGASTRETFPVSVKKPTMTAEEIHNHTNTLMEAALNSGAIDGILHVVGAGVTMLNNATCNGTICHESRENFLKYVHSSSQLSVRSNAHNLSPPTLPSPQAEYGLALPHS